MTPNFSPTRDLCTSLTAQHAPQIPAEPSLIPTSELVPRGLIYTAQEQQISIRGNLRLAIFDLDETVICGTGEVVHDGINGRFSYAARGVLRGHSIQVPLSEWSKVWNGYDGSCGLRGFAGGSEDEVFNGIARSLLQMYSYRRELNDVTLDQFVHCMRAVSDRFYERKLERCKSEIRIANGMETLLMSLKAQGIEVALCTGSGSKFVEKLLKIGDFRKVLETFGDNIWTGAQKRVRDGEFKGEVIRQILERFRVSPANACMFGDSLSDGGAFALAGGSLSILCLSSLTEEDHRRKVSKMEREYVLAEANHGSPVSDAQFVIVPSFEHVLVEPGGDPDKALHWIITSRQDVISGNR